MSTCIKTELQYMEHGLKELIMSIKITWLKTLPHLKLDLETLETH